MATVTFGAFSWGGLFPGTVTPGDILPSVGPNSTGIAVFTSKILPAGKNFLPITLNEEGIIKGSARIMYASVTQIMPTQISDIINLSTYNPQAGWTDLGATKTGIQISYNSVGEDTYDVDSDGDIVTHPNDWHMEVSTALAEVTLDHMAFIGEQPTVTIVARIGGNEKQINLGIPLNVDKRRLAILFQRPNKKIRAFVFNKVVISERNITLTYSKTGDQQALPIKFNCLPDLSIAEPTARFALVSDQQ